MHSFHKLLVAASLACALPAMAAETTLIKDVRVFDGQKVYAKRSVLLEGGRIVNADFKGKAPNGAQVVDGDGRTLMPGLIDSHTHSYQHLELPLVFGVTSELDMFTAVPLVQEMNGRMARGENKERPDIISAGILATVPGGHGTEYGMPIPTLTKPEEAQPWVDARIAEGSHFIKIVMEPGRAAHPTPTLDRATVKALVAAAHKRGKLAVVHISNQADARAALADGADGLVHLFDGESISEADLKSFVKLAHDRKAFVIPTFSVLESVSGLKEKDVLEDKQMMALLTHDQVVPLNSPYGKKEAAQRLNATKALVAALRTAGVPVLAGTDAGNGGTQAGASLHHELLSLTQAGMSPLEALRSATSVPAKAFRLSDRGVIAKGAKADLVLVDGDPSQDIKASRNIVEVWKDGATVSARRKAQQELVAKELSASKAAPLALPADGMISLFSKEKLASPFGTGWVPSNDAFLGGKSTVNLEYAGENSVNVKASVQPGFAFPWAGIAFVPGSQAFQPANLSAAKTLRFRVKGDGQGYQVGIMHGSVRIPVYRPFAAGAEWQEVALPMASFAGVDTSAITLIMFNAGPKTGDYQFQIADVRLTGQ